MKKEKQITEKIYKMYASDTGILFGLSSSAKPVVETIIGVALEIYDNERDILKKLYESEIDFKIETCWDAGVKVALINNYGDVIWEGMYETYELAIKHLIEEVLKKYPESEFAKMIKEEGYEQ
jgi:hypothetical protein